MVMTSRRALEARAVFCSFAISAWFSPSASAMCSSGVLIGVGQRFQHGARIGARGDRISSRRAPA